MKPILIEINFLLFIYNFFFESFTNCQTLDPADKCLPRFRAYEGPGDTNFKECLSTVEECINFQYHYYNSFELKCWKSGCPEGYYSNERDYNNIPTRDTSNNNCVKKCGQSFPKHDDGKKICKADCGNKYFTIDDPNTCIDSCNESYPYISESNEKLCLRECQFDKFIIEKEGKKICVSNCKTYNNSYFIAGDQKCYGKCPDTYYLNEDNFECLKICLYNKDQTKQFSLLDNKTCNIYQEGKYYYESDKILLDECPRFYKRDSHLCLYNCPGNVELELDSGKYYCNCSTNDKMINETTITFGSDPPIVVNLCVDSCPYYHLEGSHKCIDKCPKYYVSYNKICYNANCTKEQIFDISDKKCIQKSDNKYIFKQIGDSNDNRFEAYVKANTSCIAEDPNKRFVKDENDKECVSICPDGNNYYYEGEGDIECQENCGTNSYILKENNQYECQENDCPSNYFIFYENNQEAKKNCSSFESDRFKYILEEQNPNSNKSRYSSCPSNYPFNISHDTISHLRVCYKDNPCINKPSKPYYFDRECRRGSDCKNLGKFFVEDYICVDECSTTNKYKIKKDDIYNCSNDCNDQDYPFIDSEDYCISKCPKGKNYIKTDGKHCLSQCESSQNYYDINNEDYKIFRCIDVSCKNNNVEPAYKLSGENTRECFSSCPLNLQYLSPSEDKCYNNCLSSNDNPFTLESSKICSNTCNDENKYYYDKEKICISKCKEEDYALEETDGKYQCIKDCSIKNLLSYEKKIDDINMCVDKCNGTKPYIDGNFCKSECPDTKKFFVDKIPKENITCLIDCPNDMKYYTIDYSNDKILGCQTNCNNYIIENYTDTILHARLCIPDCPYSNEKYKDYKYKLVKDVNEKYCYAICPYEKPYHIDDSGAECLLNCSFATNKNYHEINDFICKHENNCSYDYIDLEDLLCLSLDQKQCPSYRKYTTHLSNGKYICSDTCRYPGYTLSTPYNTCVSECTTIGLINNNMFGAVCFCSNLYYINDSIKVACFDPTKELCKEASTQYRILMNNTKECVQTCNGSNVLSLWEDTCYDSTYNCEDNEKLITANNGQRKCDCQYRFYYKNDSYSLDNRKVKKCMSEHERCHDVSKNRFVPETLECVDECPPEFKFMFQNYFCLRNCPKDSQLKDGTDNVCECVEPKQYWHKITSRTFECLETCHDLYPVYAPFNNRCLNKCKDSYFPIFYEDKCYRNCSNNPSLNIKDAVNSTKEADLYSLTCKCKDETTWYRNGSNTIICSKNRQDCDNFEDHAPFKYLIYDTWECVDECPEEYPYFFNNYCYKECSSVATDLHVIYEGLYECQCFNIWYNDTDNNNIKKCIPPSIKECYLYPDKDLKYRINTTNECVEKCPDEMYEFNYVCYEKCPDYSKDNKKDKTCACNTNMGYWYDYEKINITLPSKFLECGVEECPESIEDKSGKEETRQYLLEEEKKCLGNCSDVDKYNYHYICVEECPRLTKIVDYNCLYYDLNDSEIENRTDLKDAANVQAYKLYNDSVESNQNEFFFDRYNTSIHIYGIDPENSYKDLYFNSDKYKNLTYIDFNTCLNRLILDKNFDPDEKIIIAKYDIYNTSYLINQVEYQLFSNKTNEKLDALVCSPYEMLISYPLNFDKLEGDYLQKFNYGKEIYNQNNYSINSFDFNSSIYKNFCMGLEIYGKDLVFEDRYEVLYPNKMLLCENNCTMNNTDFELKRINCLCTYKGDFDFDRKEEVDDIFNNPYYYIPTQSPANAEVIKCISKFNVRQTVVHNGAFYYCIIIIAIEVALTFISSVMGIDTITNFMKPILDNVNNQDFGRKTKSIGFKDQNIISTTNKQLNNPPKKNNNERGDDIETKNEDESDSNKNKDKPSDYEINIKKGNRDIISKSFYSNNNNKFKAEYIPPEYNSKFFKQTDKGVMKKIDRSKLPFKIDSDTQYLVEKRKDVEYANNYLEGIFYPSQNILIITDGTDTNIGQIAKYIKYEKMGKTEKFDETKFKEKTKLYEQLNTKNNQNKEKSFITVKKIKPNAPKSEEKSLSDIFDEDSEEMNIDEDDASIFTIIRREQLFLRLPYKKYLEKKHVDNLSIIVAEILDKIYIVKICLFLRKYDIFTHQLSLYVFCHLLLLSLLCGFFTIRVIKKIWREANYPGIGFYILYGLISNIIIWIIYQIFLYILDFRDKIKEVVSLQKELKEQEMYDFDDNIDERNEKIFKKKYTQTIKRIKCIIIAFYLVMFIIIIFCTIYLISFFALYTGTRKRVFTAYYSSLILIVIIKKNLNSFMDLVWLYLELQAKLINIKNYIK